MTELPSNCVMVISDVAQINGISASGGLPLTSGASSSEFLHIHRTSVDDGNSMEWKNALIREQSWVDGTSIRRRNFRPGNFSNFEFGWIFGNFGSVFFRNFVWWLEHIILAFQPHFIPLDSTAFLDSKDIITFGIIESSNALLSSFHLEGVTISQHNILQLIFFV